MYHKYQPKSVEELKNEWAQSPRWAGVKRPYSAEEVDRLRGTFQHDHTIARMGAERLWELLHAEKFIRALGALTPIRRCGPWKKAGRRADATELTAT